MRFSRLTGMIYVIGAVFGLLLALSSLTALWVTRDKVTGNITDVVALIGRTIDATDATITVVGDSLEKAAADLDLLNQMVRSVAETMDDSVGMIQSTADLVGTSLPGFIENTQTSLSSVETSARVVDDFLGVISAVPFIGGRYRPDVPLEQSIGQVKSSLDPLPEALTKIRGDLDQSASNVSTVKSEINALGKQIGAIKSSVSDAQKVTKEYRVILTDVKTRYGTFETRLPTILNGLYMGLTVLLGWLLVNQFGLLIHGIGLLTEREALGR
jgi:methyl-accepting chemotaxis protein